MEPLHILLQRSVQQTIEKNEKDGLLTNSHTALLRDMPDERIGGLVNEARQRLNKLHDYEVTILKTEIGHSIGLFYFTTSLRGLQYLLETCSNHQLKSMMQELFIMLLKTDDVALDLHIDTLRWEWDQ